MPSIDERVVSMAFENVKFEAGVAQTMATLTKLDATLQKVGSTNSLGDIEKAASKITLDQPLSALDKLKARFSGAGQGAADGMADIEKAANKVTLDQPITALNKVQSATADVGRGASDGFSEIERAADKVNLSSLSGALDTVTSKFSVMKGAAAVALGSIAAQAVTAGGQLAQQLTGVKAIQDGFSDYQLKVGATQTIMAGTGENIGSVTKYLKELDTYADQTIYSLKDMTGNIGKFTNAGVKLPVAVQAMKGISNEAALSGANTEEAARSMYNLGQAIGSGTVRLADWRSVDLANMGTKEFKEQLIDSAIALGSLKKGSDGTVRSLKGNEVNFKTFNQTLQDQWLTSEALTKTLSRYADKNTDLGKRAYAAATEVKTFSMMLETLAAASGTGWTDTFEIILGNLPEATKLWTGITNAIGGFIGKAADARNKVLGVWKDLGGRTVLIEGIKNAFQALFSLLKPIGQAFRDIFPKKTGQDLFEMTKNFRDFTEKLKPSEAVIDGIRRTFAGLFAVLHIGWSIVKGVIGVISDLLSVAGKGSGGFLGFTGSIGDFLVAVDNALTKGGLLKSFFETISKVLQAPMSLLSELGKIITGLFGGLDNAKSAALGGSLDSVGKAASPLTSILRGLKTAWDGLVRMFEQAKNLVSPWLTQIGQQLSTLGTVISDAFKNMDFNKIMAALQTGFIGGIFIILKKAITGGATELGGALGGINKVLGALTGNLQAMQQKVHAQTLLLIATAIGVLAASTYILSTIDPKRLASALSAMAVGLGELMGAVKFMTSGLGIKGILTLPVLALGLIGVATSTVILAAAMKIFATMSWEDIAKGMAGVAGGLYAISLGMKKMGGREMVIQGAALILIATGMNLLALAVKQFASMSWEDLGKGIYGVFLALTALVTPLTIMGPEMILIGPGLVAAAFAMSMLAGAVAAFSAIDSQKMFVGIAGMAAAMLVLAPAVTVMALALPGAVGLAAASVGILILSGALAAMGSLGIGQILKGLAAMGGALAILAVGLTLMIAAAPGAIALLAASAALAVLAPTLAFLGTLSWGTIFKGLTAIALALGTVAVAGLIAAPGLVILGIALLPLAAVFVITAGAALTFAKALSLLGDSGSKGIGVMVTAIVAFVGLLPTLVITFMKGLLEIAAAMVELAPKIVVALGQVLDTIIAFIIANAGKLAVAVGALIDAIVVILVTNAPKLMAAGAKLMLELLNGVQQNLPQVVTKVAAIVVAFLNTLASKAPALTAAGANFLVQFLNGIAAQMSKLVSAAINVITSFISAVVGELPKVILLGTQLFLNFIKGMASKVGAVVSTGVGIVMNLISGIGKALPKIVKAAAEVVTKFINSLATVGPEMVDAGYKALIQFLHGIATAIRENNTDLVNAGLDIADAIIHGIIDGLGAVAQKLLKPVVEKLFNMLPGWARKVLGIQSPSKVFEDIGIRMGEGLVVGLSGMQGILHEKVTNPIRAMLDENKDVGAFGKFIGSEFRDGLTGGLFGDGKSQSQTTIEGAFASLTTKLHDEQQKLHDQIKTDQATLDDELAKKPKDQDTKLIEKLGTNLMAHRNLLEQATKATSSLVASLRSTKSELITLGDEYTAVGEYLTKAQTALDEATRARDDSKKSLGDQFGQTPDIGGLTSAALADAELTNQERIDKAKKDAADAEKLRRVDQVKLYEQSIQAQIVATDKYSETLQKLRDLGLDDATYKKLLAEGTKGQQFADQLLATGKAGVDQLNAMDANLLASATKLAQDASTNLYQAGVDAAAGLVQGLKDKQSDIRKTMEEIAASMVRALKKKLKIKSPSQVFMEVGTQSAQGMVMGFQTSSGDVTSAAEGMGDAAVSGIQNSMQGLSRVLDFGINSNPTITPVLDLTDVKSGMGEINSMTDATKPRFAYTTSDLGAAVSSETQTQAAAQQGSASTDGVVQFTQNNYSPESLSPADVYRQTKNQLSQAKGALGFVTAIR